MSSHLTRFYSETNYVLLRRTWGDTFGIVPARRRDPRSAPRIGTYAKCSDTILTFALVSSQDVSFPAVQFSKYKPGTHAAMPPASL